MRVVTQRILGHENRRTSEIYLHSMGDPSWSHVYGVSQRGNKKSVLAAEVLRDLGYRVNWKVLYEGFLISLGPSKYND